MVVADDNDDDIDDNHQGPGNIEIPCVEMENATSVWVLSSNNSNNNSNNSSSNDSNNSNNSSSSSSSSSSSNDMNLLLPRCQR